MAAIKHAFKTHRQAQGNPFLIVERKATEENLSPTEGDIGQTDEPSASYLLPTQVPRVVDDATMAKERKRAGVERKGTRIEGRKGKVAYTLPLKLDDKSFDDLNEAFHLLQALTGADPSQSIVTRRALAVYVKYLKTISQDNDKVLGEIRTILRAR
jgi:hypothetical protein